MHYLGIDVAKAKLDCCLLLADDKRKYKVISNNKAGFIDLLAWLQRQGALDVHAVMEGTGVYHEPAAYALHEAGLVVSIVNPAQVKDFGKGLAVRTKTDRVDSLVLARFGQLIKPEAWLAPPPQARYLQALLARREAVAMDLQRERNRCEKYAATDTPALVQESISASIAFLSDQLKKLQQQIDDHIDQNPELKKDLGLLKSIPAIGQQTASRMLAVMHTHQFDRAEQLAAYLGLVPVERQSGSSVHGRSRLSKTGPASIRAVLYMAALVAIKHNRHIKESYQRLLAKGKSKMAALGAAMRKLVHLCFGVIKNQSLYQIDYLPAKRT